MTKGESSWVLFIYLYILLQYLVLEFINVYFQQSIFLIFTATCFNMQLIDEEIKLEK